jgi:hypothetical protein
MFGVLWFVTKVIRKQTVIYYLRTKLMAEN